MSDYDINNKFIRSRNKMKVKNKCRRIVVNCNGKMYWSKLYLENDKNIFSSSVLFRTMKTTMKL